MALSALGSQQFLRRAPEEYNQRSTSRRHLQQIDPPMSVKSGQALRINPSEPMYLNTQTNETTADILSKISSTSKLEMQPRKINENLMDGGRGH